MEFRAFNNMKELFSQVVTRYRDILFEAGEEEIIYFLKHLAVSKGKLIRPGFYLLSVAELSGKKELAACDREITIAALVEYLHTASLIHDDIIDSGMTRRGQKAIYRKIDVPSAVMMGDYIFSLLIYLCHQFGDIRYSKIFSKAALNMSKGELKQNYFSKNDLFDEQQYQQTIYLKTACFYKCCVSLAAVSTNPEKKTYDWLKNFAIQFGYAFQIADDITEWRLDWLDSSEDENLEPLSSRKINLPMILLINQADENDRKHLDVLLTKKRNTAKDYKAVWELLEKYEILQQSMERLEHLKEVAFKNENSAKLIHLDRFQDLFNYFYLTAKGSL